MTTTHDPAFSEYLEALGALVELPGHRDESLAQARLVGRAEVDSAMAELRDLRTALASCEDDVARLTSRMARLGARTRMDLDDDAPPEAPVGSVAEACRLVEALRADLSAAEGAWSWVERALPQLERQPDPGPVAPVPNVTGHGTPPVAAQEPPGRPGTRVWGVLAAIALVLAVILVLLVL
ncbi:MAG: hypothetical protein EOL89_00050 [Actinobacteria bacterium]|nr:hypothetical protein [Actinomycetota bacterium]